MEGGWSGEGPGQGRRKEELSTVGGILRRWRGAFETQAVKGCWGYHCCDLVDPSAQIQTDMARRAWRTRGVPDHQAAAGAGVDLW